MPEIRTVDEEKSQSRARLAICVVSLVSFPTVAYFRGLLGAELFVHGMVTIVSYLLFSFSWYAFVRSTPYRYPRRRYVSIIADLGIMTVFLHLGGKYVAAFYPIFLWIIIGNGIRFGPHFLTWAQILGALGFGSVTVFSPYWSQHREVGLGMLLGVLVLPTFYQTLLRRLRKMQELEVALARSKLADKAKDQFLATMSHEIRTPMNGVLGMAQALDDTELSSEQREHLHIITRSVESLLHIINDILDYSKITSSSVTLENVSFDLARVLGQTQPQDLIKYGLIPEFVGRLPVFASLAELDVHSLVRILTEPRNALVKQYQKIFEFENVALRFTDDALEAVAQQAVERKIGARGLRMILEELMLDMMFSLPSRSNVKEVVVSKDVVLNKSNPLAVMEKAG